MESPRCWSLLSQFTPCRVPTQSTGSASPRPIFRLSNSPDSCFCVASWARPRWSARPSGAARRDVARRLDPHRGDEGNPLRPADVRAHAPRPGDPSGPGVKPVPPPARLWGGQASRGRRSAMPWGVLELLGLPLTTVLTSPHPRQDLDAREPAPAPPTRGPDTPNWNPTTCSAAYPCVCALTSLAAEDGCHPLAGHTGLTRVELNEPHFGRELIGLALLAPPTDQDTSVDGRDHQHDHRPEHEPGYGLHA